MVSNEIFNAAYEDKENHKIMSAAAKKFTSKIPLDEMKSLKLDTLMTSLINYSIEKSNGMSFKSYLYKNMRYSCLKFIENKKKLATRYSQLPYLDGLGPEYSINLDSFEDLISTLNVEEKSIIIDRFVYDKTLKEIGDKNGYCYETARKKINTILDKLKGVLS